MIYIFMKIVFGFSSLCLYSSAEIFSSIAHIKEELARVRQDRSVELLKRLFDRHDADLSNTKILIETLDQLQTGARDPTFTVEHPLDAYRFIRNHSIIFNETVSQLVNVLQRKGYDHAEISAFTKNLTALPEDDLIGALRGIIRIQYTYDLKTEDLADGNVLGQYSQRLTAAECKDLMVVAFYSDYIMLALDWLQEAARRLELGNDSVTLTKLFCKAAASAYNLGRREEALIIYEYIMEQNPKNRYLKHKKKYYQHHYKKKVLKFTQHTNSFRDSCRNSLEEPKKNTSVSRKLFCSYVDNGHPLLRYQPGKMELLSLDPIILVFHQALTSRTIASLLGTVVKSLHRSTVAANENSASISDHRTSKGTSFHTGGSVTSTMLFKYVGALTFLRWESFEQFQVANYGIGGHYDSHHDTTNPGNTKSIFTENQRIATFMIYLTDVEKGGATVFPDANVSVSPEAGKAVFWYNVKPDGRPCEKVIHAACPVISGDKFIANIWVREQGQEFTRPCNIDEKDTRHRWPIIKIN